MLFNFLLALTYYFTLIFYKNFVLMDKDRKIKDLIFIVRSSVSSIKWDVYIIYK